MNPIDTLFTDLKAQGRKAFMPFITAGDPNLEVTGLLLRKLTQAGADIIEVGFPFSDPVADGPVIQASYTRALSAGFKIDALLETIKAVSSKEKLAPLVGMISYSIIHKKNPEYFLTNCKEAGFSGIIIPDLPVEETDAIAELMKRIGLKLILLVTPTTSEERIRKIAEVCTGFLYCVSLVGITGERAQLPESVKEYLAKLRRLTTLPLCVGFGVSTPEHVKMLRDHVDGVIVGSAIVRKMEKIDPGNLEPGINEMLILVKSLQNVLNNTRI